MSELWSYAAVFIGGIGLGYYWRGRRSEFTEATPGVVDVRHDTQRRLDVVMIRCEREHLDGHIPATPVSERFSTRDLRVAQRQGWGGGHVNSCYRHNPDRAGLTNLHVLCRVDDCGERGVVRANRIGVDFGRLRSLGWANTIDDGALCPVHSGARSPSRTRW